MFRSKKITCTHGCSERSDVVCVFLSQLCQLRMGKRCNRINSLKIQKRAESLQLQCNGHWSVDDKKTLI